MPYAFSKIDAVYVWTKGGYQIARSREDYPLFIEVEHEDVPAWKQYLDDFGIESRVGERRGDGIYFVLFPEDEIDAEWVDSAKVISLDETVAWARQYEANFQPALELLDEMYGLELDVDYMGS